MEKRIFSVCVEGQYYGSHGSTGLPVIKQYKANFKLPTLEGALSVIVKYLLNPYLTKHFQDYARFRTHRIIELNYTGRPASPHVLQMAFEDMQIAELADFCIIKQIFIDPYTWKDLEKCRAEVARLYQTRIEQKRHEEKSGHAKKQKEIDELLVMNNIPKLDDHIPNINMQRTMSALKNTPDPRATETVGSDRLSVPRAAQAHPAEEPVLSEPAEIGNTGAVLEEVPVDNDPKLTAEAFDQAAAKHLGVEAASAEQEIFA